MTKIDHSPFEQVAISSSSEQQSQVVAVELSTESGISSLQPNYDPFAGCTILDLPDDPLSYSFSTLGEELVVEQEGKILQVPLSVSVRFADGSRADARFLVGGL